MRGLAGRRESGVEEGSRQVRARSDVLRPQYFAVPFWVDAATAPNGCTEGMCRAPHHVPRSWVMTAGA